MLILKDLESPGTGVILKVADNDDPKELYPIFIQLGAGLSPCISLTNAQALELIEELKSLIK
jgi:hypothetical protein